MGRPAGRSVAEEEEAAQRAVEEAEFEDLIDFVNSLDECEKQLSTCSPTRSCFAYSRFDYFRPKISPTHKILYLGIKVMSNYILMSLKMCLGHVKVISCAIYNWLFLYQEL